MAAGNAAENDGAMAMRLSLAAAAVLYNLKNYEAISFANCMPFLGTGGKVNDGDPIVAIVYMENVRGNECVKPRTVWEPLANIMSYVAANKALHVRAKSDGLEFEISLETLQRFLAIVMARDRWRDPTIRMGLYHVEKEGAQGYFTARAPSKPSDIQ